MLTKRSILLFFCFMLSGCLLDAQWTWYSYRFSAACSESGNSVPATWFVFAALMLIPAGASVVFRGNLVYVVSCLVICLCHVGLQLRFIIDEWQLEGYIGINCYRDVGGGMVVSFVLFVYFSVVIVAITAGFGVIRVLRKLLIKRYGEHPHKAS